MKTGLKGALPVPYIVALIIAILVIAVLVYWFFVASNQGTNTATAVLCKGNLISYCTQWATCNYQDCQPKDNTGNAADFYVLHPECNPFKGKTDATGLPGSITGPTCKTTLGQSVASATISPTP